AIRKHLGRDDSAGARLQRGGGAACARSSGAARRVRRRVHVGRHRGAVGFAVKGAVLITGATGFVGMEVLARYLERSDRRIFALVRASDDEAAQERIDGVMADLFGSRAKRYSDRVRAVAGELTAPGLGLGQRRSRALADEVSTIVHSAASVSFALPLDEAREINLEGTRRMLEFAELAA